MLLTKKVRNITITHKYQLSSRQYINLRFIEIIMINLIILPCFNNGQQDHRDGQ
jgi:hypothetical protein